MSTTTYATILGSVASGITQMYNIFSPASPPQAPSLDVENTDKVKYNLELSSAIRIGMFPYAKEAKIKVEELAINFDFPHVVFGFINATPAKRTVTNWLYSDTGIGGRYLVVLKQVTAIMIRLFPPLPQEDDQAKPDINVIYDFFIEGLEHLKREYFPKEAKTLANKVTVVPDINTFDYDPIADAKLSDENAAIAVQECINLLKHCRNNKVVYEKKRKESIHKRLKTYYTPLRVKQLANGLLLLKEKQGDIPLSEKWICQAEFISLDVLVHGCTQDFKHIRNQVSSLSASQTTET